jgi:4'-phosphopantetheinyl transferase
MLDEPALHFNVTHSGDLGLVALCTQSPVGVDLEITRNRPDVVEAGIRFFAATEKKILRAAKSAERLGTFYTIWTRKEAVLKASGQGITSGLNLPDVSAQLEGAPEGILTELGNRRWRVYDLELDSGYQGAVSVLAES